MTISKSLLLTASLLVSAIAFANTMSFESLDTDGNAFISKSEAQASDSIAEYFTHLDVNEDGQLSKAEFEQYAHEGASNE